MPDTTLAVVGVLVRKDALLLTWIVAEQLGLTCSRLDKCLGRLAAIGDVKLYSTEDTPTYYGDVISGEIRTFATTKRVSTSLMPTGWQTPLPKTKWRIWMPANK